MAKEAVFLMEDKQTGGLVRVPESKLESWKRAQQEVSSGRVKTSEQEIEQMLSLGRTSRPERRR